MIGFPYRAGWAVGFDPKMCFLGKKDQNPNASSAQGLVNRRFQRFLFLQLARAEQPR